MILKRLHEIKYWVSFGHANFTAEQGVIRFHFRKVKIPLHQQRFSVVSFFFLIHCVCRNFALGNSRG